MAGSWEMAAEMGGYGSAQFTSLKCKKDGYLSGELNGLGLSTDQFKTDFPEKIKETILSELIKRRKDLQEEINELDKSIQWLKR